MSKTYTTGELAALCGVTVRTVQYYDARGMILPTAVCAVASVLTGAEDTVCAVWCIVLAAAGGVLWLKMQKRETI